MSGLWTLISGDIYPLCIQFVDVKFWWSLSFVYPVCWHYGSVVFVCCVSGLLTSWFHGLYPICRHLDLVFLLFIDIVGCVVDGSVTLTLSVLSHVSTEHEHLLDVF